MRTFLLSSCVAGALGVLAMGSANAAPIATHGVIQAPSAIADVQCRTVKRVTYSYGVKRVVTSQECARPVYRDRPVYRERRERYIERRDYRRPGPSIGIQIR
ncbi:hypothetical protein [Methylopila sp. M107]|uniref:hypothetical protein n=1 Tax=Methylopila sp. M107 TaxID=1101190 RepID=UPI000380066B|nr:hypothetical protein [Methylopila sp. M107]